MREPVSVCVTCKRWSKDGCSIPSMHKKFGLKMLPVGSGCLHHWHLGFCQGASDGECIWKHCPQLRDGEPKRSGRHCPLDTRKEED